MTILYDDSNKVAQGNRAVLVGDLVADQSIANGTTWIKLAISATGLVKRGITTADAGSLVNANISVPQTGLYRLDAHIVLDSGAAAVQFAVGFGEGVTPIIATRQVKTASVEHRFEVGGLLKLDFGKTYSLLALHSNGTAQIYSLGKIALIQELVY